MLSDYIYILFPTESKNIQPESTSPRTPGRYRTSDNTNPRLPTVSDDPAPESGTPPASVSYVHSAQPVRSFWQRVPGP